MRKSASMRPEKPLSGGLSGFRKSAALLALLLLAACATAPTAKPAACSPPALLLSCPEKPDNSAPATEADLARLVAEIAEAHLSCRDRLKALAAWVGRECGGR